jgi:hypothetical protein
VRYRQIDSFDRIFNCRWGECIAGGCVGEFKKQRNEVLVPDLPILSRWGPVLVYNLI